MFPVVVVFGYKKFKGKQKEIIEAAYTGMIGFKILLSVSVDICSRL